MFIFSTNTSLRKKVVHHLHVNMRWKNACLISQYFACRDGAHTFHGLHKDLLLLTGILLIEQHAMEDAAKRACQKQSTGFFSRERAGESQPEASQTKSKCHLTADQPGMADLRTEMDRFMLKMLCLPMGLGSFGCSLTDNSQTRDLPLLRGPFITENDSEIHMTWKGKEHTLIFSFV